MPIIRKHNQNSMKLKTLKDKAKKILLKLLTSENADHNIALAVAVGTLISILPTPGLNIILGVLSLLVLRTMNKWALFATMLFWNPIVQIPVFLASVLLGNFILGGNLPENLFSLETFRTFSTQFLLGNAIIAAVLSLAAYFIVRKFVVNHREEVLEKLGWPEKMYKKKITPIINMGKNKIATLWEW